MTAEQQFRDLIRRRRLELGLSQLAVARAIGFQTGEAINMIERGHRHMSIDRVPALARNLGLMETELVRLALLAWHPESFAVLYPGSSLPPLWKTTN